MNNNWKGELIPHDNYCGYDVRKRLYKDLLAVNIWFSGLIVSCMFNWRIVLFFSFEFELISEYHFGFMALEILDTANDSERNRWEQSPFYEGNNSWFNFGFSHDVSEFPIYIIRFWCFRDIKMAISHVYWMVVLFGFAAGKVASESAISILRVFFNCILLLLLGFVTNESCSDEFRFLYFMGNFVFFVFKSFDFFINCYHFRVLEIKLFSDEYFLFSFNCSFNFVFNDFEFVNIID